MKINQEDNKVTVSPYIENKDRGRIEVDTIAGTIYIKGLNGKFMYVEYDSTTYGELDVIIDLEKQKENKEN